MENGSYVGRALADELRDDWKESGMPTTRAEAELDILRKCIEPLKWDTWEVYEAYAECHEDPCEAVAVMGGETPPTLKDNLVDGMHLGYYVVDWLVDDVTSELATELEGI